MTGITKDVVSCMWVVDIKDPLLVNKKNNPCSDGSGFTFLLFE